MTYSRRTLRQFGGVDPSIRALEKDALATSKMGFTIKDSHAAATCYRDAQKMQKEASKRAGKHSTWLRNLESSRQDTERNMLNRSLSICMEEFDQEWKHKKVIMEAHCEHLLATVRERAEAQRHYLEKKYEVERILPVKYSSATRDGINIYLTFLRTRILLQRFARRCCLSTRERERERERERGIHRRNRVCGHIIAQNIQVILLH